MKLRSREQIQIDIEEKYKTCCVCQERKSFDDFYNFKNKSDGKSYRCKSCDDKARTNYRINNPISSSRKERSRSLKFKYGIDIEEYENLLIKQNYVCAICKNKETHSIGKDVSFLAVDHCHKTDKIRGLLCNKCNRGIGLLNDNIDQLQSAIDYLKTH